MDGTRRWVERRWVARSIRIVGTGMPVVLAIVTGIAAGRIFGRPDSFAMGIVRVVATGVVSAVVMAAADRVFRRLTPLAALFQLTLVFPDRAPSRFSVALRSGNSKLLAHRIEEIRRGDRRPEPDQSYYETLLELAAALNAHDRLTRGHCERTRAYTEVLINELELPAADADRLRWASLLHDVGKLGVDAKILTKPGKPTDEEWVQLRAHPEIGAQLVAPIADFLGPWVSAVSQHHERWDGGGYPGGLAGRAIHLGGRMVAVADAYDVMTSARSYKRPMSPRDARAELVRCSGTQFDPEIVRAFLATSLGRSRASLASLSGLIHLREAFALLGQTPVVSAVTATVGAAALTTAAITGTGMVDALQPFPVDPAGQTVGDREVDPALPLGEQARSRPPERALRTERTLGSHRKSTSPQADGGQSPSPREKDRKSSPPPEKEGQPSGPPATAPESSTTTAVPRESDPPTEEAGAPAPIPEELGGSAPPTDEPLEPALTTTTTEPPAPAPTTRPKGKR